MLISVCVNSARRTSTATMVNAAGRLPSVVIEARIVSRYRYIMNSVIRTKSCPVPVLETRPVRRGDCTHTHRPIESSRHTCKTSTHIIIKATRRAQTNPRFSVKEMTMCVGR